MNNEMKQYRKSLQVLIVDDLPQVREGLIEVLRLAGSSTRPRIEVAGEAESGKEALWQVQTLRPDVVLMDLEMPMLDGYAVTHSLKLSHPALRIIALTIHTGPEARCKAAQVGADMLVEKGSPPETLIAAIQARPAAQGKDV
jgi:DNA-binding NarL/FixJ family response regulator